MDLNEAIRWVVAHGVALLVGLTILLLIYRFARPAIHRIVPGLLHVQAATLSDGSATSVDELGKRAATLEDLLNKLLRVFVLVAIVVLMLGVFDLWSILAGIALIAAAITVASQDVVLDYVMGVLILVEGPYFKGDWISPSRGRVVAWKARSRRSPSAGRCCATTWARCTRSPTGSSASSNLTRVFSVAVVEFQVLRAGDLEAALGIVGRVSKELQSDADWSQRVLTDAPDVFVTGLTVDGASLRLQLRVQPGARMAVSSELRRRLAAAFAAASIGTGRWDTPLPVVNEPPGAGRPADDGPTMG